MSLRTSQSTHWKKKSLEIINSYLTSPPANKRSQWFVNYLRSLQFSSILEVGMFSGRNLLHLEAAFPEVQINGCDVNPAAVQFAKTVLSTRANIFLKDLHDLDQLSDKFDIVFTSGVLIHIPPEDLEGALAKCLKRANRWVIHLEQLGPGELMAGPKERKPTYKISDQLQWNCDLVGAYGKLGYKVETLVLPEEIRTNGARDLVKVGVK